MRKSVFAVSAAALLVALASNVRMAAADPSLWIGTDNTPARNVLNTDLSGNVIQTVGPVEATGFAIDSANNLLYFGNSAGVITPRVLSNPASAGASFTPDINPTLAEDMTFLNGRIWRTSSPGEVTEINPATGHVASTFSVGFEALGITAYGSDLLISNSATSSVQEYTTLGTLVPGGVSFAVKDENGNSLSETGGLALDTTNNTLYIGTFGEVLHYDLNGNFLGHFAIPANQDSTRFVDGLEFVTPEPSTLVLAGFAAALGLAHRSPRRTCSRPRR